MSRLIYWKIDYSAFHDGPGIRTAVFFKGCPMRCLWCANPEGQSKKKSLLYHRERCISCYSCVENCPVQAISISKENSGFALNKLLCTACGTCASLCPDKALETIGVDTDVAGLMKIIEKNRFFFKKTGGGVTFTGGEPLYQGEPIVELAANCRYSGIHTALETCGCTENSLMEAAANEVDWIFFDIKCIDSKKHEKLTGQNNQKILQNLSTASEILRKRDKKLIIRMVMIPGITDPDDLQKAAETIKQLPFYDGVELLAYHQLGAPKYEQLLQTYLLPDVPPATEEDIAGGEKILEKLDIKILKQSGTSRGK